MNTQYLTSPEMRKFFLHHTEHELSICTGDNALDNLKASLAHAKALLDSRRFDSVVYINIPFSKRRFTDTRHEVYPQSEKSDALVVLHMQQGRLGPEFVRVGDRIRATKGKIAVIINSWEMASSSYRYKEQLLFALHGLVCADELTVFVYSQAKTGSVTAGAINRAGLGRLSAIAVAVMEIPDEEELSAEQTVTRDPYPVTPPENRALPLSKKNNDLRYADVEEEYESIAVAA